MPSCIAGRYSDMECYDTPTVTLPCGCALCEGCLEMLVDLELLRSREDSCANCKAGNEKLAAWSAAAERWTG